MRQGVGRLRQPKQSDSFATRPTRGTCQQPLVFLRFCYVCFACSGAPSCDADLAHASTHHASGSFAHSAQLFLDGIRARALGQCAPGCAKGMAAHSPLEAERATLPSDPGFSMLTSLLQESASMLGGVEGSGDQSRTFLIVGLSVASVLVIAAMLVGLKRCLHRAQKFREPIFEEVHEEVRRRSLSRRSSMGALPSQAQPQKSPATDALPEFRPVAASMDAASFDTDELVAGSHIHARHGQSP